MRFTSRWSVRNGAYKAFTSGGVWAGLPPPARAIRHMQALVRLMVAATITVALAAPLAQAAAPPSGATAVDAAVVARGKRLVEHTKELLPAYAGANLTCASCHINFAHGTGPLSFAGIAGHYPEYSTRTHTIVALRDRIAECFFFSMNGRPPSYFGP